MEFQTIINLDNAAFIDNPEELPNILGAIAKKIREATPPVEPGVQKYVLDSNGNNVGQWTISQ